MVARSSHGDSHALYPRVLGDHLNLLNRHGDVSIIDTRTYLYGLELGQEVWINLEPGRTLVISLEAIGKPDSRGRCRVFFKLNGQGRQVVVQDRSLTETVEASARKAEPNNPDHVGSPMPGTVIGVHCAVGDTVAEGAPLVTLEAMKMETIVRAPRDGSVTELVAPPVKASVGADDLLVVNVR